MPNDGTLPDGQIHRSSAGIRGLIEGRDGTGGISGDGSSSKALAPRFARMAPMWALLLEPPRGIRKRINLGQVMQQTLTMVDKPGAKSYADSMDERRFLREPFVSLLWLSVKGMLPRSRILTM
jgi:hypothetical protein